MRRCHDLVINRKVRKEGKEKIVLTLRSLRSLRFISIHREFHFFQEGGPAGVALQAAQQRIAFHFGQAAVALLPPPSLFRMR